MAKKAATSYKQTKIGIFPRFKVVKLEVVGTKKGLILLKKLAPGQEKITLELIKKIHKGCFSKILLKDTGCFRKVQVTYSGKEALHFSKIYEMMHNLCEDAEYAISHLPKIGDDNFITRVVEILAKFQHRFVFIHPFVDYNGRMARMFTNYILMRLNLPVIEIKADSGQERKRYIGALQKADLGDYQSLELIITNCLNECLEALNKKK